jgi:acetoin utilization deacetylase AcuC-like enzyme
VAARVLQRDRHARRITVVDLDVHQGNGTAAIFAGDDTVFTFSMHGEKNFPFRKETSDLDVALADGTRDEDYLELLRSHLPQVLNRHQPDFVFYLAGADPYEGDRLGRLKLTIAGLRTRDNIVFDTCRRAGLPVTVTMSGGYADDVDAIITIHANTIRAAANRCLIGVESVAGV